MKAVKVMHTVALRTEATILGGELPANLGKAFKVREHTIIYSFLYSASYHLDKFFHLFVRIKTDVNSLFLQNHMSEMFAYHATIMSNTLGTSIVVFTRTGFMAVLLSHYRPSGTVFAFTNE